MMLTWLLYPHTEQSSTNTWKAGKNGKESQFDKEPEAENERAEDS